MPHSKRSTGSGSTSIASMPWDGRMTRDRSGSPFLCVAAGASSTAVLASAQSVEEFYKGRQINLIIGGGAGGGYDVYYRTLARHMGRHIPGNPTLHRQEPAGGRRARRRVGDLHHRRARRRHHRRVRQQRHHGPAVRRRRRALRPAQAQLDRLDRQAAERLRDLARKPDQDDPAGAGARGDRRRGRRDLEHRADAEGAQRACSAPNSA